MLHHRHSGYRPIKRPAVVEDSYESQNTCKNCGHRALVEDGKNGSVVCSNCGVILREREISEEAEYRNFDDDKEDKSRVGSSSFASSLLSDGGLSTVIAPQSRAHGYLAALHREATSNAADTLLLAGFSAIENIASLEQTRQDIVERAKLIFRDFLKAKPSFRSLKKGYMPAVMFTAWSQCGYKRTMREVAQMTNVTETDVRKAYKDIVKTVMNTQSAAEHQPVVVSTPASLVPRFAQRLNLSHLSPLMEHVANHAYKTSIYGKLPGTIAGSVILLVTMLSAVGSDRVHVNDIAKACGMAASTLQGGCRELMAGILECFPSPENLHKMYPKFQLRPDFAQLVQAQLLRNSGSTKSESESGTPSAGSSATPLGGSSSFTLDGDTPVGGGSSGFLTKEDGDVGDGGEEEEQEEADAAVGVGSRSMGAVVVCAVDRDGMPAQHAESAAMDEPPAKRARAGDGLSVA